MVESHNTDNLEVENKEDIGVRMKEAHIEMSVEGDFFAVSGDSPFCMLGRMGSKNGFEFESFELPNQCKSVRKMKFIRNSLLTLLCDDEKIYTLSARNNMEIVLAFELPNRRGIIDYDLSVDAKHLVVISALGEKYIYDFYKLFANQKEQILSFFLTVNQRKNAYRQDKDLTIERGASLRETLTRVDLEQLKKQSNQILQPKTGNHAKRTKTHRMMNQRDIETNVIMLDKVGGATENVEFFINGKKLDQRNNCDESSSANMLEQGSLEEFLKRFGHFPERHREIVWKHSLGLPQNQEAFDNLARKGLHPAYLDLKSQFAINSEKLYYRTQRILSCLAVYCPVFGQLTYMPGLVFPFVRLIGKNEMFCFEVILSFLMQWGQHFFEFAPNPPVSYLKALMEVLAHHDGQLHGALSTQIPRAQLFNALWNTLQVGLTDVLNRDDWLSFIDFLVVHSDKPDLLLHFLVAFLEHFRSQLMSCMSGEEVLHVLRKDHQLRMGELCQRALTLREKTPDKVPQVVAFTDNLPLTQNQYPIFNFYPKFSLDQHREIREEIIHDELKLQEKKRVNKEIDQLSTQLATLETMHQEKKETMERHQRERHEIMTYEQEMRLARITQAEQVARNDRLRHIQKLEKESRSAIELASQTRKIDLQFLDEEILKKKQRDNKFIASKREEEALLNLELKTAERLNEVLNAKTREETQQIVTLQQEVAQKRLDLKYAQLQSQVDLQAEEDQIRHSHILQRHQRNASLFKQIQRQIEAEDSKNRSIQGILLAEEFEKELKLAELERDRRLRKIAAGEQLKSEEFIQVYNMQEDVLKQREEQQMIEMQNKDLDIAHMRQEERLRLFEEERRQESKEQEEHRRKMKEISSHQRRAEAEDKIQELRNARLKNQIEEEKRLQGEIEQIQRERQMQKQLQQDLEFKQQQIQTSEQYERILKQTKQNIIDEEEEDYKSFQNKFSKQYNQHQQAEERNEGEQFSRSLKQNSDNNQSGNFATNQNMQSLPQGNYSNNPFLQHQENNNYNNSYYNPPQQQEDNYDYLQDSINQHSTLN